MGSQWEEGILRARHLLAQDPLLSPGTSVGASQVEGSGVQPSTRGTWLVDTS